MTSTRVLIGRKIGGYHRSRNKAMKNARWCLIGIETMDSERAKAMRGLASMYVKSARTYNKLALLAAEQRAVRSTKS